jgi:hypothetical protein
VWLSLFSLDVIQAVPENHATAKSPLRKRLRLVFALLLVFIAFLLGPWLIHAGYRAATPGALVQSQRAEYARLANGESELTDAARKANERTRYKLYLWFYARGFSIDEGHGLAPLWQSWRDLIDYWRDDDGSRFYPESTK